MRPVSTSNLLLADTTVIRAFCNAGSGRVLRDYTAGRLFVTPAVKREIKRNQRLLNAIGAFEDADGWPPSLPADPEVETTVAQILAARDPFGNLHELEDEGEYATVYYALAARPGADYVLLMDDHEGKDLARDKQLNFVDTPNLAVQMVVEGSLHEKQGERIWESTTSAPKAAYKSRLQRARSAANR